MRLRYRTALAAGFVGAVAVAAAAFGQTGTPSESVPGPGGGRDKAHKIGRNLVHSETKVQVDGGFALVIVDRGEVTSVSGDSVTIRRADGETVTVTAGEDTKVRRDGDDASVSALKTGDRAQITQVERDGSRTVRAIRAFSKEFQPKDRPHKGRGRLRRGPEKDRPVEEAPEPALFAV